ncbi:malonate decarboxylase holo-ACP synthase [Paraburkholderia rhizosphaerae]|uniref:Phosphoribosyl-dephospho-CoA transferase n=1 Tax=Paraburkholderia rhizosphaerae TaxID=480658 RepID=A0A4V6QD16_9BURK|nr:malonate decarboxylase holo-ACP synthase [Paraburkholderia rhizosphaerae]TDY45475.1 phosphoribosyl-dephospho-CoA transferase [Paraburkholderia rhizosphaerae]
MRICALPPFELSAALDAGGGQHERDACWRAHDVVRLRRLTVLDGEPVWVRDAFLSAPFAVVRRAQAASGFVAVGMRGSNRAQRYGTWVEDAGIEFSVAPEALVAREPLPGREQLPVFAALAALRRASGCIAQFVWGPAGSVGFELATGTPTATGSSDLDLLIRTPDRLNHTAAARLLAELLAYAQRAGVRVDAQLETPAGGVALAELAAGKPHVMARADAGPSLVADPWAAANENTKGGAHSATARPDAAVAGAR